MSPRRERLDVAIEFLELYEATVLSCRIRSLENRKPSLKELSSAICDFAFSSLGQFSRSVIILLLAAGVMVGPHGNNEIPGSPS